MPNNCQHAQALKFAPLLEKITLQIRFIILVNVLSILGTIKSVFKKNVLEIQKLQRRSKYIHFVLVVGFW